MKNISSVLLNFAKKKNNKKTKKKTKQKKKKPFNTGLFLPTNLGRQYTTNS